MQLEQLLGGTLVRGTAAVPTASALAGAERVLLYFSASWCPPCRAYAPALAQRYALWRLWHKNAEVVFISSDRSPEQFAECYGGKPWLALPWEDRARAAALSRQMGVQHIPTVVLLDGKGAVVDKDARHHALTDELAAALPDKLDASLVRGRALDELLASLHTHDEPAKPALTLCRRLLTNVLDEPAEPRFRRVHDTGKVAQALHCEEVRAILAHAGFHQEGEWLVLSPMVDLKLLTNVRAFIDQHMDEFK